MLTPPYTRMLITLVATTGLCIGCSDRSPTLPDRGADVLVAEYQCTATLTDRSLRCETPPPAPTGGARMLYGLNQVKLTSSNVLYDSVAQVFAFDVNVKNLLTVTMGTTTGQDTTGLKAFFETGPTATAMRAPGDTGTIFVRNPDGVESLTAANQPYFLYRQILTTNSVTPNRRWELHCPPTVRTFAFTLRVFTRTQTNPGTGTTVPTSLTISPDSLLSLYSHPHLVYTHRRASGPYPRAIVLVGFRGTADADEREAAINQSGGKLIGGDGIFYYLLVSDDGSGDPLWGAIDKLRALPQVELAVPDMRSHGFTVSYRVPEDGLPGWHRSDWKLDPDSADGQNWAWEAIEAPSAWGCEADGSTAAVAVVDPETTHGTLVHSIIATPGDDSIGTTGVVWHGSRVTRTDASRDSTAHPDTAGMNLTNDLTAQVKSAAIINISWGAEYADSVAGKSKRRLPHTSGPLSGGRQHPGSNPLFDVCMGAAKGRRQHDKPPSIYHLCG